MITPKRRLRPYLAGLAGTAIVAAAVLGTTPVIGAGDEDVDNTNQRRAEEAETRAQLPPGLAPATRHEVVVVPAGPDDPDAPATTYADPPKAAPGDEAPEGPIPDYLKDPNIYRLSFVTGDYTPPQDERIDPRILRGLATRGHTYGYVMFEGQIQARKRLALEQLGVVFMNEHTFNSLQAIIPAKALPGLRVSPFVRWVGYAQPEQKVDEFIHAKLLDPATNPDAELAVFVNTFVSDLTSDSAPEPIFNTPPVTPSNPREQEMRPMIMMSNGPFQRAIEEAGGRAMGYEDSINTFYVWAKPATIRRLMALDFVAGMDTAHPITSDHDRSMRITQASYMGSLSTHNGKDTTVAICDSGVYHGHSDISQTYAIGWDYSGEGNSGRDDFGHGTHVAGTVFGDGSARSDRRYRGSAPSCGTLSTHPTFRVKLLDRNGRPAANWPNYAVTAWNRTRVNVGSALKATVVQNSWGYGGRLSTGYYGTDSLSRGVDTNTHSYRQTYVMSSGNMGGNASTQYLRSNRPPCVSKSALSVGNTLDYDDTSGTYGGRYPGAQAYGSSKGPTRDGRMKPQVSAPGTWVVSAKTNTASSYISYFGTSMAAPHVSGIAAQLHDASTTYRDYPCLTRAKLMASASPFGALRSWSSASESYYNRRGMGMADAYSAYFTNSNTGGWFGGTAVRTLTRSSAGFYFDVTVPADATRTFFVMTWDEKAPALNATRAVLYNCNLVLDVFPFDNDITKGEYYSSQSQSNYDWYGNVGSIAAVRGKRVRVKVPFVTKPSSSTEVIRVAVGYHIARGDTSPSATVSLTAPTLVKPGATFSATARATMAAYRADSLYMYLTSNGATATSQRHTTRDARTLNTSPVVSGARDSNTSWTLGAVANNWSSTHRTLNWTMRASSTSSLYTLRACARGTGTATACSNTVSLCVDGLAPNRPPSVSSSSHVINRWSNNRSFVGTWNAASDVGCAGVAGYGIVFSTGCTSSTIRTHGLVTTASTTFPVTSGTQWYFNINAHDRIGNISAGTCRGPFRIDTVAPTSPRINVAGGVAVTRSLIVALNSLNAVEPSNGSGLSQMRFSNNGSTWSPWEAFAATKSNWDLSSFGGTAAAGTKTVWVQYRDVAGNASARISDRIVFDAVDITSVSPNRGPLIGGDTVTVNGAGFITGRTSVTFNGLAATRVNVISSTRLTCVTPTRLVEAKVPVRVAVRPSSTTYTDTLVDGYAYIGGRVLATGQPRLDVPFPVTFDAPVDGGKSYVGAASFGKGPIPLPPHPALGLSPDALFFLTVGNAIPTIFANIRGTLNVSGRAVCTVTLPNVGAIVGVDLYMAFLTIDATKPVGVRTVSTNRKLTIQS